MEIQQIKKSSYIRAVLASYEAFPSRMALFFSVISYVYLGNYVSTQKVKENTNKFCFLDKKQQV